MKITAAFGLDLMRVATTLTLLLATRAAAPAEPEAEAEALIERGIELREQGHDEEGLAQFQKAFALSPSPRARAQVALAEQALGRWRLAERDMRSALAADADPWIAKNRPALSDAFRVIQSHLGELRITGGASGAKLLVDGEQVGQIPLEAELRIELGTHTLEAQARGYYPVSQPIVILAGTPAQVSLEMRPIPIVAVAPTGGDPPLPPPRPFLAPHAIEPSPGWSPHRKAGLGLIIGSAVPLGIGIAGLIELVQNVSAYNADPACPGIDTPIQPGVCGARVGAASDWRTASIVALSTGGVALAAGVVVSLTAPAAKGPRTTLGCAPSGTGARCTVRF